MSLTCTFTTQAGNVAVTLDVTETGTFDIIELGNIEYDFDLTNYNDSVNKVGVMYNRSSMVVYRYTTAGDDFYDILYNHLYVSPQTPIPVTIEIGLHSGLNAQLRFNILKRSLSRKINEQSVKIDLDPLAETTITVGDVIDATYSDFGFQIIGATLSGAPETQGIAVGTFIHYMVSGLNSALPTIVKSSYQSAGPLPSEMYPVPVGFGDFVDDYEYLVVASGVPAGNLNNQLAISGLRHYAVLEGGIYGTGFDYNFYVHRTRIDDTTILFDDDVESCSSELISQPYSSIALTLQAQPVTELADIFFNLNTTTTSASSSVTAEKTISGLYPFTSGGKARWDEANTRMEIDTITGSLSELAVVASGLLAHKTALNASTNPIFKVSSRVLGIDKVKPYQTVQLSGTTFPTEFRFNPAGAVRYYRPTYLSYNLYSNTVEVKMYSIT